MRSIGRSRRYATGRGLRRFLGRSASAGAGALALFVIGIVAVGAQSELDAARARAAEAAELADAARDAAEQARQRATEAIVALEEAIGDIEEVDARLVVVELHAGDARSRVEDLRASVRELAVRRYVVDDRPSSAELAADDPHQQARIAALFRFAVLGGGDDLDQFRVVVEEYGRAAEDLRVLRDEQQQVAVALEERNRQLAVHLEEMESHLAEAEEQEAVFRREVARLEEQERRRIEAERRRRLEEQRRAAQEEARRRATEEIRQSPTPVLRGDGLLCPIGGPTTFSDTWGAPRSGGRSHKGVDMFAPRGTPVVAPVGGTVSFRESSLGGKSFYLAGDDGNRYYGAHLDSYGASGRVSAGTVVGTVGNTGNARFSSPHLHFEIHLGGTTKVNPTPTVRTACG